MLLLSNAVANRCAWAVAFHSTIALAHGAPASAVEAIRRGELPGDPRLAGADPMTPQLPVVPVRFARDGRELDYFSTVTTLGTPQDVTLQELRIECFFPARRT